ncbi:MAG: MgtC/SapB family protein [Kofleriaceae bacterium]|nr:MAG: MgtC/SapB family protein [Kofleriaceae bacterium]MBZ0231373.1 MgtC/SapB family protein [Kofleriaceae bacterium]
MKTELLSGYEVDFLVRLAACLVCGTIVGIERELRGKPAGISTHCFVIAGACLFTMISAVADPNSTARIAAQVVSGVGFIGAGMIIKSTGDKIRNLTTAAAVWFAAAIGLALGMGWFVIAGAATIYAVIVPRIPHAKSWLKEQDDE